MATRSYVTLPFSNDIRVKRYVYFWTIEGWSAYLKQKGRGPLNQTLWTEEFFWMLGLDCKLHSDRKPEWVGLRVMARLEQEPAAMVIAEVCCSLLGLKSEAAANPRRETLWEHGMSWAILMDLPEKDVLATLELDEIKIRIELDITLILSRTVSPYGAHDPLAIERMTSLPKEVFDHATTDMVIVVDSKAIPAHQSVLADSSPIFESLLRAASWKKLDLTDFDLETAKELVKYTYLKKEPNFQRMDVNALSDLLNAAETYGLEKLQKDAEDHIASNLDPENAIDFLLRADKIGNLSLKKMVLLYIKNNKQLFSKDKFGRLENRLLVDIIAVMSS